MRDSHIHVRASSYSSEVSPAHGMVRNKDTNEECEMSLEGHAKKKRLNALSCRHNTPALVCPVAYSTEVVKYVELKSEEPYTLPEANWSTRRSGGFFRNHMKLVHLKQFSVGPA